MSILPKNSLDYQEGLEHGRLSGDIRAQALEAALAAAEQRVGELEKGEWAEKAAEQLVATMRYAIKNSMHPEQGSTGYHDSVEIEGFKQTIMKEFSAALNRLGE